MKVNEGDIQRGSKMKKGKGLLHKLPCPLYVCPEYGSCIIVSHAYAPPVQETKKKQIIARELIKVAQVRVEG